MTNGMIGEVRSRDQVELAELDREFAKLQELIGRVSAEAEQFEANADRVIHEAREAREALATLVPALGCCAGLVPPANRARAAH